MGKGDCIQSDTVTSYLILLYTTHTLLTPLKGENRCLSYNQEYPSSPLGE